MRIGSLLFLAVVQGVCLTPWHGARQLPSHGATSALADERKQRLLRVLSNFDRWPVFWTLSTVKCANVRPAEVFKPCWALEEGVTWARVSEEAQVKLEAEAEASR